MTDSPPTRRFRSGARILLSAMAIAVAASCSATDRARTPTTPSPSSTPTPTPTATSPAVLPGAADGDDTQACATGRCEIRVTEAVSIPVPATTFGFGPLTVASIADGQIRVTGPLFSGRVSGGGGGCTIGLVTASATDPQDYMHLTCPAGARTTVDGMSFTVLAIVDRTAVIRIGTVT